MAGFYSLEPKICEAGFARLTNFGSSKSYAYCQLSITTNHSRKWRSAQSRAI
jgi:hypothetical protein